MSPRASRCAARMIWARNTFPGASAATSCGTSPSSTITSRAKKGPWYGDKTQSTLWEEKKPGANRIHPTAKPVELIGHALLNSSKTGDVVADLFGGSGSTLIACERRFQEYSGKSATLDGDGRAFYEIDREGRQEGA